MLNVYNLSRVMTESAGSVDLSSIEAYDFIGSMDEATQEFNALVMAESVEFNQFNANAQEIIVEAAMSNPDRLGILSESVLDKVKNGIAAFFDRLIKFVKGIIDKLKAFFLKLTGKTDKWYSFMKPKIDAAKQRGGYTDATAEMHKWNIEAVTSGLKKAVDAGMNAMRTEGSAKPMSASKMATILSSDIKGDMKAYDSSAKEEKKYSDADSDKIKNLVTEMDKEAENYKNETEEMKSKFPEEVAKILGSAGLKNLSTANMDDLWKSVRKEVTGGEKVTVKYVQEVGIDKMMESIKASTKTIDDLKKAYDGHLKFLGEAKAKFQKEVDAIKFPDSGKVPTELVSSMQSVVSAYSAKITTKFSNYEAAINTIRGENVKAVQDMNSEFMGVLNKFANIKSKKD